MLTTVLLTLIIIIQAFSLTSCGSLQWFNDAKTSFKNGRYAPEIQDILPEVLLNNGVSTTTGSVNGVSTLSNSIAIDLGETITFYSLADITDTQIIPFSALEGMYYGDEGGFDTLLSSFFDMRVNMEELTTYVLLAFEKSKLTEKGVWKNGIKYEENINGDKFIYRAEGTTSGAKLSMYANGATATYRFQNDAEGDLIRREYSYFNDEQFIYMRDDSGYGTQYMSFGTASGLKKGIIVNYYDLSERFDVNEAGCNAVVFDGNSEIMTIHYFTDIYANGIPLLTTQTAMATFNGILYGDNLLDLRLFSNIKEIYYTCPDNHNYSVTGIKLANNTVITTGYNDIIMCEALMLYTDLEQADWEYMPTGGFYAALALRFEEWSTLSNAIPAQYSQLTLINGFEASYNSLQDGKEGYFDEFCVTEFEPLASIKVSYESKELFTNAIRSCIQIHHLGF